MSKAKEIASVEENEMIKKIKEMFGSSSEEEIPEEVVEPRPPLEEAIERALYSLNEIYLYAEYGRTAEAAREAKEALAVLTALKQKWDEQNAIMDALSKPAADPHADGEEDD